MASHSPPVQDVILTEKSTSGFRFSELWSKAYAGRTFMLWVLWPALLFSYYGLTTWLGALLVAKGFAVSRSITFVMTITLGGIPGFLAAIYLIEKIGRRAVVIPSIILTAVSAYFYGQADNLTTLYIYVASPQFFTYAMWSAVYAYTPELVPDRNEGWRLRSCLFDRTRGSTAWPIYSGIRLAISRCFGRV